MKISKLIVPLCALCASSCQPDKTYVVEGSLYGGRNFEDQYIYLVPLRGGYESRVDSAAVHDGRFRFDGVVVEPEVCLLRMRPMMRLFIQEATIIREPGHIKAVLSAQSKVGGTALNDSLQHWVDAKAHADSLLLVLKKQLKKAEGPDSADIAERQDSIRNDFSLFTLETLRRNSTNIFGEYLDLYIR